ncbi:MAG: helix-turn-helix domain-containing protein [Chloroflexi bacterium]|nr:helix-turn-helix domain-containing protein [Chloroflexota bacterium]MBI3741277.1 helix-turn-helix domain-containing protein [Chloroflexota bacterium]
MARQREFLTTNEVAQTLGISPFTIRRYIKLRKLKAVKLEGSYRVRSADLEKFLQAREIETEEELAANGTEKAIARARDKAREQKKPFAAPKKSRRKK